MNRALVRGFLLEFLFEESDPYHPNNSVAADYFDNPSDWKRIRAQRGIDERKYERLKEDIERKVGMRIVHLSYGRIGLTEEEKKWYVAGIADEIFEVFQLFVEKANKDCIHNELRKYVAAVKKRRETG